MHYLFWAWSNGEACHKILEDSKKIYLTALTVITERNNEVKEESKEVGNVTTGTCLLCGGCYVLKNGETVYETTNIALILAD